jgi:hypothetical protein
MQPLTTLIPDADAFLALSPRHVAGIVLSLMNAASEDRNHPRKEFNRLRHDIANLASRRPENWPSAARRRFFAERFIVRDYGDAVDRETKSVPFISVLRRRVREANG